MNTVTDEQYSSLSILCHTEVVRKVGFLLLVMLWQESGFSFVENVIVRKVGFVLSIMLGLKVLSQKSI